MTEALQQFLAARGLQHEAALQPPPDELPWFLQTALVIAAWISACMLMGAIGGLLGAAFREAGLFVFGLLFAGAGTALLRYTATPLFLRHMAVPFVLAGGLGMVAALALNHGDLAWKWALLVLGMGMFFPAPQAVLRFSAALIAVGALVALIAWPEHWDYWPYSDQRFDPFELLNAGLLAIGLVTWGVWRSLDYRRAWAGVLQPLAWAGGLAQIVLASVVTLQLSELHRHFGDSMEASRQLARFMLVLPFLLIWVVATLDRAYRHPRQEWPWLLSWPMAFLSPLFAVGAVFWLQGQVLGLWLQRAVGALVMLIGLGFVYFQLEWTLLQKSLVLIACGCMCLGLAWLRTKRGRV